MGRARARPCSLGDSARRRRQADAARQRATRGQGSGERAAPQVARTGPGASGPSAASPVEVPTYCSAQHCNAQQGEAHPTHSLHPPGVCQRPALLHAVLGQGGQHRVQRHAAEGDLRAGVGWVCGWVGSAWVGGWGWGHVASCRKYGQIGHPNEPARPSAHARHVNAPAPAPTLICSQMSSPAGMSPGLNSCEPAGALGAGPATLGPPCGMPARRQRRLPAGRLAPWHRPRSRADTLARASPHA